MALWHGAEFVERNGIRPSDPKFLQRNWPDEVRRSSQIRYGWSYICAWIATTLAALSSAIYLLAALFIVRHKEMHTYYPPKMYCLPPSTYNSYHGSYPGPYTAFPVEEYFYAKAPVNSNSIQRILSSSTTTTSGTGKRMSGSLNSAAMGSNRLPKRSSNIFEKDQPPLDYIY